LHQFHDLLNNLHKSIKITVDINDTEIPFLAT
jgi:hypothetical protein